VTLDAAQAVTALAALAQETRLAIFRHLVTVGADGAPAGSIAEALGVPAPTLSFHLKELDRAALIESRRDGRSIYYSANYGAMRTLLDFLTEDCCRGHPEVCFTKRRRG